MINGRNSIYFVILSRTPKIVCFFMLRCDTPSRVERLSSIADVIGGVKIASKTVFIQFARSIPKLKLVVWELTPHTYAIVAGVLY